MTGWPFWHVTLTVAGEPVADAEIRVGLERLSHEHPFLLSGRYWISFFPGVALAIAIIGINLAGDHLRDVLNPRNLR